MTNCTSDPDETPARSVSDTERQGYQIHSGPYETETEARENLKGVKGMVRKLRDGWYVLELCYVDTETEQGGSCQ